MKKLIMLFASLTTPLLAAAQTGINTTGISRYSTGIVGVINNILVPVLMAIAFIVFLWGVYKYFILGAADEKSRTDGRQFTLWGIIGFVVILSLWAFVNLLRGTFGLDNNATAPPPPTIWGTSSGVNASNRQQNTFGTSGNGGGSPVYGQNGQPYVWGTSQDTAYNNMQSTCSQNGFSSTACQNAQATYLQNYNPAYSATGSCPAGCSPGTLNPNQCVDAGGEPCGTGGGTTSTCPEGTTYDGSYDCVPNTVTGSGTTSPCPDGTSYDGNNCVADAATTGTYPDEP